MSDLILHAGAYKASLSDITNTPLPPATRSHHPIHHRWFLDTILENLSALGYATTSTAHALCGPNGEDYFGVIHLDRTSPTGDYSHVLGLRNSHRQTFSAQGVLGTHVFVCDNLAFRGTNAVMRFSRKHTPHILRDFPRLCADRISELPSYFADTEAQITRWKEHSLGSDPLTLRRNAADICMTALSHGATNGRQLPHVWSNFQRPDGPGGHTSLKGSSLWTLFNAFTETEKTSCSAAESQRRTARLSSILDRACQPPLILNCNAEPIFDEPFALESV